MDDATFQGVLARYSDLLGDNDSRFLRRIYAGGLDRYRERIAAVGFTGHSAVLDAGCGFGQWALALAACNASVVGVDVGAIRLRFLSDLSAAAGVDNLQVRHASLDRLPFDEARFDAVFCYGVVFCTDWKRSLAEMLRVVRRGGRVYVNVNDIGWTLHLFRNEPNRADDYDPRAVAVANFQNTLAYERDGRAPERGQIIISCEQLCSEAARLGAAVVACGAEGTLRLDARAPQPRPFFQAAYDGLPGCFEVVLEKPV
ncbi:MAG: class I SAM-dependent methyltransferase [Gammaproteobacteria bacterium]